MAQTPQEKVREVTVLIDSTSRGSELSPLKDELRACTDFPTERHRVKQLTIGRLFPFSYRLSGTFKRLSKMIGGYIHKQKRKYPFAESVNLMLQGPATYAAAEYFRQTEPSEMSVNNILLIGSKIPSDFPWDYLLQTTQIVENVINFYRPWPVIGDPTYVTASDDFLNYELSCPLLNYYWWRAEQGRDLLRTGLTSCSEWTAGLLPED